MSWREAIGIHAACDIFPPIAPSQLAELAADIKANGMQTPIVLLKSADKLELLDGRNRLDAAELAGLAVIADEPCPEHPFAMPVEIVELVDGFDPVGYVASANLIRRHLLDSQRAMVAARIADHPRGGEWRSTGKYRSAKDAGAIMNVPRSAVARAKTVIAKGVPELVAAVDSGQMKESRAEKIARKPPEEQRAAIKRRTTASGAVRAPVSHIPRQPAVAGGEEAPEHLIVRLRDFIDSLRACPREVDAITKTERIALALDFARALKIAPAKHDDRSEMGSSAAMAADEAGP